MLHLPVIKKFDKMVLDCFLVSRMNDNLSRTHDIYVHFHPKLEKNNSELDCRRSTFKTSVSLAKSTPIQRFDSMPVLNSPNVIVCSGIPTIGMILLPLKR